MTGALKIIFLAYIEPTSLRSQLEYWNAGILDYGKIESWVLVKFFLTGIK